MSLRTSNSPPARTAFARAIDATSFNCIVTISDWRFSRFKRVCGGFETSNVEFMSHHRLSNSAFDTRMSPDIWKQFSYIKNNVSVWSKTWNDCFALKTKEDNGSEWSSAGPLSYFWVLWMPPGNHCHVRVRCPSCVLPPTAPAPLASMVLWPLWYGI
jgi:hypothetical protein